MFGKNHPTRAAIYGNLGELERLAGDSVDPAGVAAEQEADLVIRPVTLVNPHLLAPPLRHIDKFGRNRESHRLFQQRAEPAAERTARDVRASEGILHDGIVGPATGQIDAGVYPHWASDPVMASSFHFLSANGGFHRARITKQGATITFAFDENYSGAFVPDATYAVTNVLALAPWLNNTNSRIFFGAGNTVDIFDDLVVRGLELNVNTAPTPLTENSGVASIRVERLRGTDQPANITYGVAGGTATLGVAYFLSNGTLNFAAGVTNLSIPLTIIDDALVEGPETILLGFTNSAAGWT